MSKKHPWTAFYWDDWDLKTAHLSHIEYSIYHRLLTRYYRTQKPLLANATELARLCLAVGEADELALRRVLVEFFQLRDDGYHNDRADEEIARAIRISKERAMSGSFGGRQKASNSVANAKRLATHSHSQDKTPPAPLSGGLTNREFRKVSAEMEKIGKAMQGANYDLTDALQKACQKAHVDFERARYMLGEASA